jgi:hypothetical protein
MLSGRSPFRSIEADDLRKECAKGDITYPKVRRIIALWLPG